MTCLAPEPVENVALTAPTTSRTAVWGGLTVMLGRTPCDRAYFLARKDTGPPWQAGLAVSTAPAIS